ncbi:MAG: hypothetical protein E7158_05475 [Firmicutes bacterium]|nr:hypothetical protein [Bacillota bacterium]
MRKVVMSILAVLVSFTAISSVNAMTESELKNYISAGKTVNGKNYNISQSALNQINQFLANNDLTDEECDKLAAKYDEAYNIAKNSGAKSYDEFISKKLNTAVKLANETASEISAIKSITISKDGNINIVDNNDKSYTVVDPVNEVGKGGAPIRATGTLEVLYVTLGVSVLGVLLFANKVRKANN